MGSEERGEKSTCDRVVAGIFWTNVAFAVAVESCHGLFAEEA